MCALLSPGSDVLTDNSWTLLYIFCIFCSDLVIVEMGMRSEDVQDRSAAWALGSVTATYFYTLLPGPLLTQTGTGNIDI